MPKKTKTPQIKTIKQAKPNINWSEISDALLCPHITEKATEEEGKSKYIFKVPKDANKITIKNAIERLYGKKVVKVNIINNKRKAKKRGRKIGFKSGFKKAIVSLKEGEKIDLFAKK
jgi:large subunit ribosomal protein L23